MIGPLCLDHAKALKNSKKKLRNAARAIGAFKLSGAISVSPSDAVAASSSKPKPTPLVIKDDDAVEEYSIATADAGGDANAEEDLDSLFDDIMATHIEENEESDSHTSSKPTPTLPVVKQNAVEEYSIAAGDADAEDDFNSLFDDIMATHIEENDESDSQASVFNVDSVFSCCILSKSTLTRDQRRRLDAGEADDADEEDLNSVFDDFIVIQIEETEE